MIQETGRIIEIKEVNGEKQAIVECVSKSACKSCSNNDDCGVGIVAKSSRSKTHLLSMPFKEGMLVDESIELLIENKEIVKSSTIVYIIPLFLFVFGTLIGHLLFNNEGVIILISVISLALGVVLAKATSSKLYPDNKISALVSTK